MPGGMPKANTFSICAVDPDTGEAGVAVASRCLSVGAHVPYAEPGVGAVATQAMINPAYGPAGLALLRKGVVADEVVRRLTDADVTITAPDDPQAEIIRGEGLTDEGADFFRDADGRIVWLTSRMRQLGVVDRGGRAAVHTGQRTQPWAGAIVGEGFCCQGNLLAGEQVVAAMAEAFVKTRAEGRRLAAPLLAAIQAGDAAGGDRRGKQAAGILVVRHGGHWTGSDRWCDVRVDDHAEPVAELARILGDRGFLKV